MARRKLSGSAHFKVNLPLSLPSDENESTSAGASGRLFLFMVMASHRACSAKRAMSLARQSVTPCSFTGLGALPSATHCHQQERDTGMIGGSGGTALGSPTI